MTSIFLNLPVELQRQILGHLYRPWHLQTERLPAHTSYPVYTFVPTSKLEAGPVLVCRSMHQLALSSLKSSFTGTVDASDTDEHYSIIPKYKYFLPFVSKLVLRDLGVLATMGNVFQQKLAGLRVVEIAPPHRILTGKRLTIDHMLTTDILDDDLTAMMVAFWNYWYKYNEFLRNDKGVQVRMRQRFNRAADADELLVTFNLSPGPVAILSKERG